MGAIWKRPLGEMPAGREILYQIKKDEGTGVWRKTPFLLKKAAFTGEHIKDAGVVMEHQLKQACINLEFDETGARLLERITAENIKKRFAIVIDGKVLSAPVIQARISGGSARITGRFTEEEAEDLATVLKTGAYPAKTIIVARRELTRDLWLGAN